MVDVKQSRPHESGHSDRGHSRHVVGAYVVASILFVLNFTFCPLSAVAAPQEPDDSKARKEDLEGRKLDLEVQELNLEVDKLRGEAGGLPSWFTGPVGIGAGLLATAATVWVARRTRFGALDQSVHATRLATYPDLVKATKPLALYFPEIASDGDTPLPVITPATCRAMGAAMSKWYFEIGGLLLSSKARDAYFSLATALTLASVAKTELKVPKLPEDAPEVSKKKVDDHIKKLKKALKQELKGEYKRHGLDSPDGWEFGGSGGQSGEPHRKFQDFLFLQRLSSKLRSRLSEDIRSRRRPA